MKKYRNTIPQTLGFSLVEIAIVLGVVATLFVVAQNTAFRPQQVANVSDTLDTLVSDISLQQNKSMSGNLSTGSSAVSYGVYFQSDRYILFRGSSYDQVATDNFTISLNPVFTFSAINLPSSQLVFATGSGVLSNYNQNQRSVSIRDSTNNVTKTLQFNSLGVVDSVQ